MVFPGHVRHTFELFSWKAQLPQCRMLTMGAAEIEIVLNGIKEKVYSGVTIADLLSRNGEKDKHLIVECNNRYVHSHAYPSTVLHDGDKLEFINPDFGG